MNLLLKQKRNKIMSELWDKLKAEITMQDLGEMFNLKVAQVYKIIYGQTSRPAKNNQSSPDQFPGKQV